MGIASDYGIPHLPFAAGSFFMARLLAHQYVCLRTLLFAYIRNVLAQGEDLHAAQRKQYILCETQRSILMNTLSACYLCK